MRLCSIASGSSGNCIYVGDDQTHLLVDTGISKKRIEEGLSKLEIKGDELEGILITHEHVDHIQGLGVFSRKYEIPIYATPGTIEGIRNCKSLGKLPEGLLHEIEIDHPFSLGTLNIDPFAISHDANEPSGYRIENGKKSVAVATDLGVYDDYTVEHLSDLNAVALEANHDYDLALLDMMLPGIDGFALLPKLQEAYLRGPDTRGCPEQGGPRPTKERY